MKKVFLLLVLSTIFCKVGFSQFEFTKEESLIAKILYFSKQYKEHKTHNNKINASIIDYKEFLNDNDTILREIKDSIQMEFEVVTIEKMTDFYKVKIGENLKDKKLKKVDVYHITLCPIVEGKRQKQTVYILGKKYVEDVTYHIFSVGDTVLKSKRIKEGQRYNFLLLSFFDKELPDMYGYLVPVCFDNVCTLRFPIGMLGNFYTTPNLKGLYYTKRLW